MNDSDGQLASVEVSEPTNDGMQETIWTFYRTEAGCQASLREHNTVPERYQ